MALRREMVADVVTCSARTLKCRAACATAPFRIVPRHLRLFRPGELGQAFAELVTRDSMIGTGLPLRPEQTRRI
jgi:hypothetical protein